jgi:hypothetical protein
MSVTFNRTTTVHTPGVGASSSSSTITGEAFGKLSGALEEFEAAGLTSQSARLLVFTPETYGYFPAQGDTIDWEQDIWTVHSVRTLAPDGVAIMSYVVIVK